jgi:hypothetical protein
VFDQARRERVERVPGAAERQRLTIRRDVACSGDEGWMAGGRTPFGDREFQIRCRDDTVAEQAIAAGLIKRAEIAKTTKKIGR